MCFAVWMVRFKVLVQQEMGSSSSGLATGSLSGIGTRAIRARARVLAYLRPRSVRGASPPTRPLRLNSLSPCRVSQMRRFAVNPLRHTCSTTFCYTNRWKTLKLLCWKSHGVHGVRLFEQLMVCHSRHAAVYRAIGGSSCMLPDCTCAPQHQRFLMI